MSTECICSEKGRMERLEQKIDKLTDLLTDVRLEVAKLDNLPKSVKEHEEKIHNMERKLAVVDALASKRQVLFANLLAFLAVVAAALPWLIKVIK